LLKLGTYGFHPHRPRRMLQSAAQQELAP